MGQWNLGIIASSGGGGGIPLTGSTNFYGSDYDGNGSVYLTVNISAGYDENWNQMQLPVELQALEANNYTNSSVTFFGTDFNGYNIDGIPLVYNDAYYYGTYMYIYCPPNFDSTVYNWAMMQPYFNGVDYFGSANLQIAI